MWGSIFRLQLLEEEKSHPIFAPTMSRKAIRFAIDTEYDSSRCEARDRVVAFETGARSSKHPPCEFHGILYASDRMRELIEMLKLVARTNEVVLLTGETGTGKELLARAIHNESKQSKGPFIPFNCSALSRDLVESRFFGHARGAFTGAHDSHQGVIRAAKEGTVFLDEIGDLSVDAQGALLR